MSSIKKFVAENLANDRAFKRDGGKAFLLEALREDGHKEMFYFLNFGDRESFWRRGYQETGRFNVKTDKFTLDRVPLDTKELKALVAEAKLLPMDEIHPSEQEEEGHKL